MTNSRGLARLDDQVRVYSLMVDEAWAVLGATASCDKMRATGKIAAQTLAKMDPRHITAARTGALVPLPGRVR